MKILEANRERKVSSSELADWFGIAYGTYRNQRKKKLEELKDFQYMVELSLKKFILMNTINIKMMRTEY